MGAVIGFLGSYVMWRVNVGYQDRLRRIEYIRNMIRLVLATGTFSRSLLYAKLGGLEAVSKLGANPLDELMAYTMVHVSDVAPFVQEISLIINEIHQFDILQKGAAAVLLKKGSEIEVLLNETCTALVAAADREKIEKPASAQTMRDLQIVIDRYRVK